MSRQIQIRRGTSTEHENFTGAIGEITMDTTNKTLRVHDGTTAGGTVLAKQSEIPDLSAADYVIESQLPTSDNNYIWYRKYKSGWVEIGGVSGNFTNTGSSTGSSKTITLPIEMADTKYQVCLSRTQDSSLGNGNANGYANRVMMSRINSTTQFTIEEWNNGSASGTSICSTWRVSGFVAQ